ncbi:MAG: hypothetical protein A2V63_03230 [Candidatus Eisenbacteria bacterium RBG_19FT_COMBO_70_11]|nr:MAG: hypothetical protein A2V63_03230 [Candidatus Eisenbacteria bacterium RBG_19FT_COMBO_70_11]
MESTEPKSTRIIDRVLIGALIFLVVLLIGIQAVHAAEIVPSLGLSRPVNGDAATHTFLGLAVRGHLAPMLKSEIGLGYRSDAYFDGALRVRQWPLTASLWVTPLPTLYAGGGAGIYVTTYDYQGSLPYPDTRDPSFGMHLGGGFDVPLGPLAALDLNGRYVMLQKRDMPISPREFKPDFWTTSPGLAIRF